MASASRTPASLHCTVQVSQQSLQPALRRLWHRPIVDPLVRGKLSSAVLYCASSKVEASSEYSTCRGASSAYWVTLCQAAMSCAMGHFPRVGGFPSCSAPQGRLWPHEIPHNNKMKRIIYGELWRGRHFEKRCPVSPALHKDNSISEIGAHFFMVWRLSL